MDRSIRDFFATILSFKAVRIRFDLNYLFCLNECLSSGKIILRLHDNIDMIKIVTA